MNMQNAEFIKSSVKPDDFIIDNRPQIVFSGKSNVGKSSVINKVLGRKNFARVGGTPGKTVHINYFLIDNMSYFVDLPGYGYAKVSKSEKARWARLMEEYFSRQLLTAGVMIVDSRHAPTADDKVMAGWYLGTGCPMVVVANKVDKLKKSQIEPNLEAIRVGLQLHDEVPVIAFSAEKGIGKEILVQTLQGWSALN